MLLMNQFRLVMVGMAVLFGTVVAKAQTGDLIVQRDAAGLYLEHQVAPKENFYSIGRLFNISPKVIAPFNGLALNGGLSIGQVIKIPLKDQNYTAVKKKGPTEVLVPLYRVSEGKKIVAGFLKVNKGESPLANGGPAVSAPAGASAAATPPAKTPVVTPAVKPVTTAKPLSDAGMTAETTPPPPAPKKPVATKPVATTKVAADAGMTAQATTDPGSVDPLATPTTPAHPVVAKKKAPVTTVSAPATEVTGAPTTPPPTTPQPSAAGTARYSGEGSFHPDYLTQTDEGRKTRSASGLAGVFKSTSGWDNGKFYALMKGVERGTVVKVTNLSNNKIVFVKVLGDIADIKQNSGMLIVLSDAAVSQLGATTDRFTTALSYAK